MKGSTIGSGDIGAGSANLLRPHRLPSACSLMAAALFDEMEVLAHEVAHIRHTSKKVLPKLKENLFNHLLVSHDCVYIILYI